MIASPTHRAFAATGMLAAIVTAGLVAPQAALSIPGLAPTASFTATPNPAAVGQTVDFDGSASSGDGIDSTVTAYDWDLDGNGSFETSTGTTPTTSRAYTSPGTIPVTLRVTDSDGDTDEATVNVRVNAPPVAGFIFEPSTPAAGEQVTFSSTSSDPDGSIPSGSHHWDFDADGQFDDAVGTTVSTTFASPGNKSVGLEVTDADGAASVAARNVPVQAAPPSASFTFAPSAPLTHEPVTFDGSASTAAAGETISSMTWDLDSDGSFDDASGPIATFSYSTPGQRSVRLRVEGSGGGFDVASAAVPVGNRSPRASFVSSPDVPRVGNAVKLTSTSSDPDGPITSQAWDLDGDGEFDDAQGGTAERTFAQAGPVQLRLRVVDSDGAADVVSRSLVIDANPLELMSPFPIVGLLSEVKPSGRTVIERLKVSAPEGSDVTVRCHDKSCPFRERRRTAGSGQVKFRGFNNPLSPGTKLEVLVTDPQKIGKFTSFKLRKGKAPKRKDQCLAGEEPDAIRCPP